MGVIRMLGMMCVMCAMGMPGVMGVRTVKKMRSQGLDKRQQTQACYVPFTACYNSGTSSETYRVQASPVH